MVSLERGRAHPPAASEPNSQYVVPPPGTGGGIRDGASEPDSQNGVLPPGTRGGGAGNWFAEGLRADRTSGDVGLRMGWGSITPATQWWRFRPYRCVTGRGRRGISN